jgi:hypothetical protein
LTLLCKLFNNIAKPMLSTFFGTLAQINLEPPGNSGFSNLTNLSAADIISRLVGIVLVVAAIIFFFVLIIGGIRWILSGGDKAQTEAARGQITAAIVGLVIVFAAWAITKLLENFFGVSILSLPEVFGG